MNTQVLVRIEEDGAGAERLAALADALRTELLNLDVDDVRPVRSGRPPAGARATADLGGYDPRRCRATSPYSSSRDPVFAQFRQWQRRSLEA